MEADSPSQSTISAAVIGMPSFKRSSTSGSGSEALGISAPTSPASSRPRLKRSNTVGSSASRKSVRKAMTATFSGGDNIELERLARARASRNSLGSQDSQRFDTDDAFSSLLTAEERLERAASAPRVSKLAKLSEMDGDYDIRKQGAEAYTLMQVLLDDAYLKMTCNRVPMTLLFFALFAAFVQIHYQTPYIHLEETNIRADLVDAAEDVREVADVFDWVGAILIPKLWSCKNIPVTGSNTSSMGHNILVGGVLFRTAREATAACDDEPFDGFECTSGSVSSIRSQDPALKGPMRRLADAVGQQGRWLPGAQGIVLSMHAGPEDKQTFQPYALPDAERAATPMYRRPPQGAWHRWQQRHAGSPASASTRDEDEDLAPVRRLKAMVSDMEDVVQMPNVGVHTYSRVLPISLAEEEVHAEISKWAGEHQEQPPLVTGSSHYLTVEAIFKNDDLGRGLTTQLKVQFHFSRGGMIYTEVDVHTIVQKGSIAAWGVIGLWMLLLGVYTLTTPYKAYTAARRSAFMSHFLRLATFIEWVILLQGWMIVGMLVLERMINERFLSDWQTYTEERMFADKGTLNQFDEDWSRQLRTSFLQLEAFDTWMRIIVADYHLVLLLRFLLAARGQPRLAILLNTIQQGLVDLGHLCVAFVLIFFGYVMTGHIIFGSRMQEFATLKGSFAYCLQIVFQREYPWDDFVVAADAVMVWLWVWSFLILVVLVMMSLVLAMIFDHYEEVRRTVSAKDTIWHTARRLFIQLQLLSSWWSDHDLMLALNSMAQDQPVTATRLKQACNGIADEQVSMLFDSAKNKLAKTVVLGEKNLLPETVASILVGVTDLRKGVRLLRGTCAQPDDNELSTRPGGEAPEGPSPLRPRLTKGKALKKVEFRRAASAATLLQSRPLVEPEFSAVATAPRRLPPTEAPRWLQGSLVDLLQSQQADMDHMSAQLDEIGAALQKKGISLDASTAFSAHASSSSPPSSL